MANVSIHPQSISKDENLNSDVSRILSKIATGDSAAASELLPLVYEELRKLARSKLAQERPGQTLQATALVHDAYLRLVGGNQEPVWDHRGHFFAAAAEAMRRILVEQARRRNREKHGGGIKRVNFQEAYIEAPDPGQDLVTLDAALDKLKKVDGTAAELVQLRYFAGLSLNETAEIMDISPRTANRVWAYARAWLHREIRGEIDPK
jgi:RNA polymerase sigma factor (TIGR02999 family)